MLLKPIFVSDFLPNGNGVWDTLIMGIGGRWEAAFFVFTPSKEKSYFCISLKIPLSLNEKDYLIIYAGIKK